ncbi:hypothetical protein OROMI_024514 [Orobanche minor]
MPSQNVLKIRDGTPLEAGGILTYRKGPRNCSVWHFSSKLDVPGNVVQKKRVARILLFKIRPSQEILKIRDGTPLEAEGIFTYRKKPPKLLVARILVFKIRSSQEILKIRDGTPLETPSQNVLKIRDGTPLEAGGILTYRKGPRNCSVWHFSSKLDVPGNVVQKKRVARILLFKIRPSQEILKIRDGTPLEAEGILTYRKKPPKLLDVPSNVVQKKRVARILVFKIRPSQKILKIRDGTPLEAEGILTYRKSTRNCSVWHFSSKLDVPSNVVQKERVARILVFKIRPSQKILKIRDGTPLEAEGILTYRKSPRNCSVWHFSSKLDVPSNVVQKKRVERVLVFKIRPSKEILKIRDGTPLEAEEILTYIKSPRYCSVWHFSRILTYRKGPRNCSVWHFSIQKKRVARILVFKIRPSKEILKIRDVARILVFKIRPSQKILKIRDGTSLEAEGILTYRKSPRNCSVWHFSSKLDVPSNVVQKERVARILVFKIRPSQKILKIRDGTSLEAEGILTYRKSPRNCSVWHFSSKLDVPSNVVQKERVARILVFKIRPSQKILKIRDGNPLKAEGILTYIKSPRNCSVWHFSSKLDVPSNVVHKKRVERILVFKIRPSKEILKIRDGTPLWRPSQEILKIRDGTPLEAEGILTYRKSPRNCSVWHFSSKLDVPSNVVQKKRVERILVFKIRPSKEILKIRDGTPLEAEEILTYRKSPRYCSVWPSQNVLKIRDSTPLEAGGILTYRKGPRNCSVWHFSSKLDVPSNVVQKKRVARILVFKIRSSQEILKIRDGTPLEVEGILTYKKRPSKLLEPSQKILKIRDGTSLEAEGILTYRKSPRNCSVWHFSSKLDVPSNVVQKERVARILVFKIRPSQKILKIRDGNPLKAEGILTYIKSPRNCSVWHFSRILTYRKSPRNCSVWHFSSKPSQKILEIRDGTSLEAEGILTYIKSPRNCSIWHFSSKPSQEILKIRDGTPLEAEGILTYRKSPRNCSVWHFSSKLDVPSNVVQKERVARILFFKIRPSQKILKIRDGNPLKAEGILTYIKSPRNCSVWHFSSKPSQEILKIRDGTPLEAEGILTYRKSPRNCSVWHFSSKLDVPSNVVQKKRVERILVFKIRPSKEILKIRDGTPLEAEEILTYRKSPRYCSVWHFSSNTPLEAGGILTYRKGPRNCSVWHFSSKLDVPSNVVQKKRVARILVFKIRSSQEILKIRDGTPLEMARILVFKIRPSQKILKIRDGTSLEAEGILTYRKSPRNCSVWHFSSKLDVPSNVVQKERVARILVFKIRPSQKILKIRDGNPLKAEGILTYIKSPRNCSVWHFSKILKIRDGTPLEAEGILTYRKSPRNCSVWHFSSKPSQEILKIRDGTPLEAEGILTYRKSPRNCSVWHFSSKLDVPSNVVQKERVARILFFKIRPSQKILKIRDGNPLKAEGILTYIKSPRNCSVWPSQEILKIRDGTPLEAEGILTYRKSPRNCSVWHFSSKLDVPSNVVQKKRVERILVFKIRPSKEILKIRDGTPLEAEEILTYRKSPRYCSVWHFSYAISKILKIRDGTSLEAEGILTYRKSPRNCSIWHFSSKLDVPSNVVQKERVARILVFKIRPSQKILKIRDGKPLKAEGILTYIKSPRNCSVWHFSSKASQEILKIRDGTPLEAEGILTYRKSPRNCSVWHFSSKLDVPSNVVQKKRVERILVFKIRPSKEILKIRDEKSVARILVFKIRPSQKILEIRDGTSLEAEGILTYRKGPRNCSVWHFSSKLDVPSNVVQKERVAPILVFKIRPSQKILKIRDGNPLKAEGILTYIKSPRNCSVWHFSSKPSQEILKIRDGTPLEAEGILTYRKSPRNCSVWHFSSKLDVPSNVVQKERVARILVFKIRPSQEILKIRDGTSLEAEGILTYRKKPPKLLKPSKEILKIRDEKRVARILVFKIRPSQKILKIRDGTPLEAEGILTYRKSPRNCSVWHFSSKLDVPSNVVQKERVARILVFKIRPSQKILKIRDGTPLKAEGILTYRKSPRNCSVWHFSSKLDVPSNVVQKKRVACILVFKIRPSQEILKIRDGTPLEAEGILTYRKSPRNCSVWHFSSKLDVPSNVVQKKRVERILVFKIRPSKEILKIRDGTPLEAEEILTYRKSHRNCSVLHFSSKLDVPSNVVQKKRVARILLFKIRPSQETLKIRDGAPLGAEGILTYRKKPPKLLKKSVARILVFKIRPSQKILEIRDGTSLEAEGILTYRKGPRNCSVWHFSSKLDVPSNVVQKERVAPILVFKIRPSQKILKIRDGNPLKAEGILTYIKSPRNCSVWHFSSKPSQEILKIRDGTPLEAEGILTYRKSPRNCSVWHFSSKLDVPSNVVQKERVARILVFKIRPSQKILKIRDGNPLKAEGILTYIKSPRNCSVWHFSSKPSQNVLKIRDGTPLEAGGILTYRKGPRNCSVWHFSSKLDVPSNVVQKKRVARILLFKIRPSQEILKIRDGTSLEMSSQEILKIRDGTPLEMPSKEILKIRDGTPLEAEGILTYRKKPPKLLVARILVFKIRPSQKILKIRDGTPLEAEGILTYRKSPRNCSVWHFSSKLDVPSNVVQKERVARILVFKIRPSQKILKIRDGTPLKAEGILTYRKSPRNCSVWHFSSKLDVPSNVVQKKRVACILVFKIRPSQEILKIRDGTPLEAEGILTYRKSPRNCSVWHFSSKLDVPSNVVQKKRVERILVFKIRPSKEILKIRDGTPLEAEEILTYRKSHRNCSVLHFSSKLDVPSNVVQKKRVARILLFKIRPSQETLKIRDGAPLGAEGILTYRKKPPKLLSFALF